MVLWKMVHPLRMDHISNCGRWQVTHQRPDFVVWLDGIEMKRTASLLQAFQWVEEFCNSAPTGYVIADNP